MNEFKKESTYSWIPKGKKALDIGFPWTRNLLASVTKKSRTAAQTGKLGIGPVNLPVTKTMGRAAKNVTSRAARETDVGAVFFSSLPLSLVSPVPGTPEMVTSVYAYGVKPIAKRLAKSFSAFA